MPRPVRVVAAGLVALLALTPAAVWATGIRVGPQGVRAFSMANAFVAYPDDPSAVHYNPAGLTLLEGHQATVGSTFIQTFLTHRPDSDARTAKTEDIKDNEAFLPLLYLTSDLGTDLVALGFGVNSPFGLSLEYSGSGFSRYVLTKGIVQTATYHMVGALRPCKWVSVGAGARLNTADSVLEKVLNNASFGEPDGFLNLTGDGSAWSGTVGVVIQPHPQHSVGGVFTSGYSIDHKGVTSVVGIGPVGSATYGGRHTKHRTLFEVDFPAIAAAGYAFMPNEATRLEVDAQWTDWSTTSDTHFTFQPTNGALQTNNPYVRSWEDTWSVMVGAERHLNEQWRARTGWSYENTPVPGKTYDTFVPDNNQHVASVGLGYDNGRVAVDGNYAAVFVDRRDISSRAGVAVGADLDGEYDGFFNILMLAVTLRFS